MIAVKQVTHRLDVGSAFRFEGNRNPMVLNAVVSQTPELSMCVPV